MFDLMRLICLEIIGFLFLWCFVDIWVFFFDRFKGKRVVGDFIKGVIIFCNL